MPYATTSDNVQLYFEEAGEGTPILFIHEFAADYASWEPQMRYFSRSHRCITYSARGYIPSHIPEAEAYSYKHFRDDAIAMLDHLKIPAAHLVGLSMGASIIQDFYAQHSGRVASMVLADTRPGFEAPFDPAAREEFLRLRLTPLRAGKEPADIAPSVARSLMGASAGEDVYARLVESMQALHKASYMKTIEGRVTWQPTFVPSKVTVPTLVVVGADDRLTPPAMAKSIADAIPGAHLAVIPAAGHLSNIEQPKVFNEIVLGFLAAASRA